MDILEMYDKILKEDLALYGLLGKKTKNEKFAGAEYTLSIEVLLPNGKAIQGPDAHYDGQKFAKAFNIKFLDKNEKEQYAYQNTWAITTRIIGILIACHGDNRGIIIPPQIAENQVVIIPIVFKNKSEKILKKAKEIGKKLKKFNPLIDTRQEYSPGWKFNEYELKGVPLRIEIGPKDLEKKQVTLVRRDTNEKKIVKENKIEKEIESILKEIQTELYNRTKKYTLKNMQEAKTKEEVKKIVENKKIALAPLCDEKSCEEELKEKTNGAKTLNIPFEQPKNPGKCIICNKNAEYLVRIGKSY